MMPDLGKYALEVMLAYGASLVLLAGLVWASIRRGARVRAQLHAIEARRSAAAAQPPAATDATQGKGARVHG
jgi:heme exporter protein D